MKRNTFYLVVGILGVVLVAVLWASIQLSMPVLIQVAFLAAVLAAYALRRTVAETIHDERTNVITQHAAVATLNVFWVVFFVVSLGSVVGAIISFGIGYAVVVSLLGSTDHFFEMGSLVYLPAAMLVGTVVCITSGLYPAWRASNLDPIEALRAE